MKIYLKLLAVMLIWGGTFTSARLLGNELDPSISAFLRFLIASSVLLVLLYLKEGRFPRFPAHQLLPLTAMGCAGVAFYNLLFFYGLAHAEASRGSLIIAINPLLTALGAALILRERFSGLRILGFGLCMAGAAMILTHGKSASLLHGGVGLGELAFIGCAVFWAAYTLTGRFMSSRLSSLATIAYASTIGTGILFVVALNNNLFYSVAHLSSNAVLNLLFLSILATVISYVWFQDGIQELGAAKAAIFIYFMPVSAVFWAYLILDEKVTLTLAVGATLIISGIYLANRKPVA